uniref:Uncharacterized protein n=1 Tax=Timema bartmani TaxID=61472 RepID=A0A7R9I224_9NEOP|nr:unnamed protein product [Timema bartmani]
MVLLAPGEEVIPRRYEEGGGSKNKGEGSSTDGGALSWYIVLSACRQLAPGEEVIPRRYEEGGGSKNKGEGSSTDGGALSWYIVLSACRQVCGMTKTKNVVSFLEISGPERLRGGSCDKITGPGTLSGCDYVSR